MCKKSIYKRISLIEKYIKIEKIDIFPKKAISGNSPQKQSAD